MVRAYATAEKRSEGSQNTRSSLSRRAHSSLATFGAPGIFFQALPIGDDERSNPLSITQEINYLGRHDRDLYKGVRKAQLKAPVAAQRQYVATYYAMNRMRSSLNRPPIPDPYLKT